MTVRFGLWRVDGEAVAQVDASTISSEDRLVLQR